MKKFLIRFFVFLLILAAAAYLLYPFAADQYAKWQDTQLMAEYRKTVRGMTRGQMTGMMNDAAAYNRQLESFTAGDVFTVPQGRTSHAYRALMDVKNGVIGQLSIPKIQVSLPIYHSADDKRATQYLVHLEGSSLPADGGGTHIVLAGPGKLKAKDLPGQIGLTGARMLEDLDQVTPGDLIILTVLDRTMVYRVEWAQTLAPDGLQHLDLTAREDEDALTLMTEKMERRLLVRGVRVKADEVQEELRQGDRAGLMPDWQSVLLLGSPVLLLGMIYLWIVERFKKRSYRLPIDWKDDWDRADDARSKADNDGGNASEDDDDAE